jgi:hypothetical protein
MIRPACLQRTLQRPSSRTIQRAQHRGCSNGIVKSCCPETKIRNEGSPSNWSKAAFAAFLAPNAT